MAVTDVSIPMSNPNPAAFYGELSPLNPDVLRQDFPILSQLVYGKPLVYLDNGATTQKPSVVIDRMTRFYQEEYGTVRRGVYALSATATEAFEKARQTAARFLNASTPDEIVFTKGTTEAINLVASTLGKQIVGPGDEILISAIEHHANIVPWQQLCIEKGATLKVIPVDDTGELAIDAYVQLLNPKVKLVALTHVSNALGTINPIGYMIQKAHTLGIPVLIDGAQGAPHCAVDVQGLDCDFYVFSGHKTYGPTGIGILYGKMTWLNQMPPYQFGGDMIDSVTFEKTTFAKPPRRFEAGTPPIVEVIGLDAALTYLMDIGLANIEAHEQDLLAYATEQLIQVPGLRIIGNAHHKAAVISFVVEGIHPHDMGTLLDEEGVAIRAGHHCAQPVMARFGIPATSRASFGLYNTRNEVDALVQSIHKARSIFQLD